MIKKTKMDLSAILEEEKSGQTEAKGLKLETSSTSPTKTKTGKPMGRPKRKPESRQVSFHLPVELIELLQIEADRVSGGNKSALFIKMADEYFTRLQA